MKMHVIALCFIVLGHVTAESDRRLCDKCEMKNGVGYINHPTDCNQFIQCSFGSDKNDVTAINMPCPPGLYWNQDKLTCVPSNSITCPAGACASGHSIGVTGNCNLYHACESGHDVPKSCPVGLAFKTDSCVSDPSCSDHGRDIYSGCDKRGVPGKPNMFSQKTPWGWQLMPCAPGTAWHQRTCRCSKMAGHPPSVPDCDKKGVPGNPNVFSQKTPWGWQIMPCAPGTAWHQRTCRCSKTTGLPATGPNKCEPELDLQFNTDTKDSSKNKNWVGNERVRVANGAAIFDGNSRLMISRFSNHDFRSGPLVIKLRYKEDSRTFKRQGLLSNGDCGVKPSIAVGTNAVAIDFKLATDTGASGVYVLNPGVGAWKDVTYIVNDGVFSGRVNRWSNRRINKGLIRRTHSALIIGDGHGYRKFRGSIDYVTVYFCLPSDLL